MYSMNIKAISPKDPAICTTISTLNLIGKKWTLPLLQQLCTGTRRFGELQRALPGVSPRTLTQRLQELEREKLISRKVFQEVPLHVEYSLTPKGETLKKVVGSLHAWSERYT
jgi:DNA-binding HxlR family transcriptional regulator